MADYLRRGFGARWESADPAAVLDARLVRPSRSTLDAAFAAFAEVRRCLGMSSPPSAGFDAANVKEV